jgi:hypothetical protein
MTLGVICIFFLVGTALSEPVGLTLAAKGRSNYVIVVGKDAPAPQKHAAAELAKFLEKVTGAKFEIRPADKAGAGAKIAVGPAAALKLDPKINLKGLGADGIVIQTRSPHLILTGGPGAPRGTLYAVYTFLEDAVGCRWWTPKVSKIPSQPTLKIPSLNVRYVPVLEYRRTSYARDSDWAVRNKENGCGIDKKRGGSIRWKGWVHTFHRLVPPEKHFKEHPEWFAEINGKRVGQKSQLCLTNKQMQAFLIKQVKKWLDESPAARIISVSQNDNSPHCQCPRCRAVELAEGNRPSGPILRFVNAVAEAIEKDHPNVLVSTLAYQYSQRPPLVTKPRRNVIVRLCSHECSFAQPLTDVKNRAFHDDIIGWSKICNRLYIWDYVTNFSNFLQPHPNLRVLGPNLRFFIKHGVKGIYEQGNRNRGGEMAELRTWVLTKLMWNPQADEKKLIKEFLAGYYEEAAPFIEKYLNLIHDEVARQKLYMRCYVSMHASFLTPKIILQAERLFLNAELAVAKKPEVLERVKVAHVAVRYIAIIRWPEMQQAAREAKQPWPFPATRTEAISQFERVCSKHNITRMAQGGRRKRVGWLRERYGQ